ncbi:non-ribosomal peptide synthetase [Eleftheria terrae]|uniref:non-ribosomal peptide synthetase n=1 Tax=Eleftheria terrae TaxID=1597781 RepID=UPI00263B492D|nr:non-ribosomal peptide synthetase [Eleftheria terrae]WKB55700.1 amino acid adenylation domain-containing protein [Eleftheria terrae]
MEPAGPGGGRRAAGLPAARHGGWRAPVGPPCGGLVRPARPPAAPVNAYGPTEAAVCTTLHECAAQPEADPPVGRPIDNVRIYVLDARRRPVPVGVEGELYIGGVGVARGYLDRPELTAERFVRDPFSDEPGARLYRTGDLARWLPAGELDFLGRNDHQVKIRGFRIEPGEIEARLVQHPAVRDAVVLAREDRPGDKRLVAYYTVAPGQPAPTAEALRAHLAATLPEHMLPAASVELPALPLGPNGKLDRRALPAPQDGPAAGRAWEAPVGDIETTLARLWSELLQVERVGRQDDFFQLGGHSLLAVRLASRLRVALGVELGLAELFARPTLAGLAQAVEAAARSELPPIAPGEAERAGGPLALSFAQQRLWFLAQMDKASQAYHMPLGLRLSGPLDGVALRGALDRIVARHAALRTRFVRHEGTPAQEIAPPDTGFALQVLDLRGHPQAEVRLQAEIEHEAQAPFDLERGPLARGRLLVLGEADHVLLLTLHHIVSDGWSMGVLTHELEQLYAHLRRGAPDPLPALPLQYADYAAWQRRWLAGTVLQAQTAYWQRTLQGAPVRLELPTDRPRPPEQDHAGAEIGFELDAGLTAGLKALAQRHGATLFMTLLAGWAVVLARLSGQDDLVIGTPVANRQRAELEPLIGFFVNTLALRLDLSGEPSVADFLQRVKTRALEAQQHQDLPFEQVVDIVKPPRSLSHSPLFQALFSWHKQPERHFALDGLQARPVGAAHATAQFDVTLNLVDAGDRIVGALEYATALFDAATIERHLAHLRQAYAAMAADEGQAVARLPLLSTAERGQLLDGWNDTACDLPPPHGLHQHFEAQAARTPQAPALRWRDVTLSYDELNREANQLAHHLRALGLQPDDRVAVCVERSPEMVVGLLAILKAGGAYVPLDPGYPPERLAYMCEDSAPVAVLVDGQASAAVDAAIRQALARQGRKVPVIDLQLDARRWSRRPEDNPDPAAVGLHGGHLAYVIYTSGSTGVPKGVMIEHRGLANYLAWAVRTYAPQGGAVVSSSLSFDATVTSLWTPLMCGGCVQLLPERQELDALEALVQQPSGCGLVKITPAHLDALGQRLLAEGGRSHVDVFVIGGEALSPATVALWQRLQPGVRLINEYGPTETVVGCVVHEMTAPVSGSCAVPIGRPIANTRIYLLDRLGQPVPVGVIGEMHIGGAGVARGYLRRPELTAERFLHDPFAGDPAARMYKTGDLARWLPDGTLEYLGRNDFQVKIRGFRIEPGEIEARLLQHPAVREAAVLVHEERPGDKRLLAYYTVHAGQQVEAAGLREHAAAGLPEYMVPAAWVMLDALPLTANGKLDRAALPAPGAQAAARPWEPPQGEVEGALAAIWAEVLQVERIGRHDDFFELGGHSLLAVKVASLMRRQGLHADVGALFASPTLAALAASVGGEDRQVVVPAQRIAPGCQAITPELLPLVSLSQADIDRIVAAVPGGAANVQDIYPLAPLQEGILFHHLMASEGDVYLTPALFAFDRRERLDAYLQAMQAVIDRHDILRTAVQWAGLPEPVQVVWRRAPLGIEEVVLDAAAGDAARQLRERIDPRRWRLDVRSAPLMRVFIAHDAARDRWLALWLLHHLAADHTTLDVMHQEIQAHLLGRTDRLPAPLPFRNFVAQARHGVSREAHEAFFREMLGDVEEPTAPFELSDVQGEGRDVAEASRLLDATLAARLRETARTLGLSAASLVHQAWAHVLARICGRPDVVFGTVLFGRMQGGEGAERVLGLFLNTLPLRVRFGDDGVLAAVRRTHGLMARLLRHEHAPLALAQRCSSVPAATPLFTALLNYRHGADLGSAPPSAEELAQAWSGIEFLGAQERTNYPLMLSVDDLGEGFLVGAQVRSPLDPQRLCAFMESALQQLVDALQHEPSRPARSLDVLPAAERRQLLQEWNQTQAAYPRQQSLHGLIEAQARRTPQAVALVHGSRSLSYAALDEQAGRLATQLRRLGVQAGERVAICVERGVEMVVGLLAVLKAGAAYVPLDPAYPAERLQWMCEDSRPRVLLTQATVAEGLRRQVQAVLPQDATVLDLQADAGRWAEAPVLVAGPLEPEALAYVIYTSGSTGRPKGVMVRHRGVVNLLWSMREALQVQQQDRVLALTTLAFDIAALELYLPLVSGGRCVVLDSAQAGDAQALAEVVEQAGVTLMQATPATWRLLLDSGWSGSAGLKALCGGEALERALAQRLLARVGQLWNVYGPTETTIWSTAQRVQAGGEGGVHEAIGRPLANTQVYVLDGQGEPVPRGASGELYIGGDGVAQGYWGREELTQERFVADRFGGVAGARLYRTGDLVRWRADGVLEFLGRNDHQVKLRGYRIELGEIEARLAQHPGVKQAVVVAREDSPGERRLVAYHTAAGSQAVAAQVLREHVAAALPAYMVPAAYVALAVLPQTPNGKLDRRALPAPEGEAYVRQAYEAPQGELEQALAGLWAGLLQQPRIGRHDNFFDLGGHSLLATQLMVRVQQEMDIEIPIPTLFSAPTLAAFAEAVVDARLATFADDDLEALVARL